MRIIISCLTIFLLSNIKISYSQLSKISLTLKVKDSVKRLSGVGEKSVYVNFACEIKNDSKDTIYIVNPNAYKIFPHPWIIYINGIGARFWSGDIGCAPSFKKEDILILKPGDSIQTFFDWHGLFANYSCDTGVYEAEVKYSYDSSRTYTMGASTTLLTNLTSGYSNTTKFQIYPRAAPIFTLRQARPNTTTEQSKTSLLVDSPK